MFYPEPTINKRYSSIKYDGRSVWFSFHVVFLFKVESYIYTKIKLFWGRHDNIYNETSLIPINWIICRLLRVLVLFYLVLRSGF